MEAAPGGTASFISRLSRSLLALILLNMSLRHSCQVSMVIAELPTRKLRR